MHRELNKICTFCKFGKETWEVRNQAHSMCPYCEKEPTAKQIEEMRRVNQFFADWAKSIEDFNLPS